MPEKCMPGTMFNIANRIYLSGLTILLIAGTTSCRNQPSADAPPPATPESGSSVPAGAVADELPKPNDPITARIHTGNNAVLLNHLESSRAQVLHAIHNLSDDQWTFRESTDRWNIAEVTEHIVNAERLFRILIQDYVLDGEENEIRVQKNVQTDEEVISFIKDRTNRINAPKQLQPSGVYKSVQQGVDAFNRERAITLDLLENTRINLRGFSKSFPGTNYKPMDGFQWFLYLSGHSTRHVSQIVQVKASTSYPRI